MYLPILNHVLARIIGTIFVRPWDVDICCKDHIKEALQNKYSNIWENMVLCKGGVAGVSPTEVVVKKPYDLERDFSFPHFNLINNHFYVHRVKLIHIYTDVNCPWAKQPLFLAEFRVPFPAVMRMAVEVDVLAMGTIPWQQGIMEQDNFSPSYLRTW